MRGQPFSPAGRDLSVGNQGLPLHE